MGGPLNQASPLEAALYYASLGWHVVPGHPVEKRPLTAGDNWGATTDEATIRAWWTDRPDALVGAVMGPSGLLAVDVDVHDMDENGFASLGRLLRSLGKPEDWLDGMSLKSRTGGGGVHHVFRAPTGLDFSRRKIKWMPGVDVMVGTTFLILPPSCRPESVPYEWVRSPEDHALGDLPDELLQRFLSAAVDDGAARPDPASDLAGILANGSRSGSRNQDLIRLIGWLRRTVGSDQAALADVRAQLERWRDLCQPPYRGGSEDDEFERTWASGVALDHTDRNPHWPATEQLVGEGLTRLTEYGLAAWMEPRIGARVRYHTGRSKLLVWDGQRWAENDEKDYPLWPSLQRWGVLHQLEQQIADEAAALPAKAIARLSQFLDRALSRKFCSEAALRVGQDRPVGRDDLDAHAHLLHCANGVVDLRDGTLAPHDPDLLNTRVVPHAFDPLAASPALAAQLESMFPGDPEMQAYLQRAVGVSLFGDNRGKVMFVLRGPANTGKSTLLQALLSVLGADAGEDAKYADTVDKKVFVTPRNEQHPAGLADAMGYRLALMSEEYGPGDKLNMPVLKAITGADRLKARMMRENFWSGVPRCTPWMATNHDLRLAEFDESVRTRLRIVDVPGVVSAEHRRDNVREELVAEASGLLAWAVQGAVRYTRGGLADPDKVLLAVAEAVDDQDRVKAFVDDELEPWERWDDITLRERGMAGDDLWTAYQAWCADQGAPPLYRNELMKRLKALLDWPPVRGLPRPRHGDYKYPVSFRTD